MSNEKQETIADIVREMRGIKGGQHTNGGLSYERWRARCQFADDYADRIEAAAKRERDSTREKSSQVGNAAKMREALERIRRELIYDSCRNPITAFHDIVCEVSYSALVAPPRNCDVLSKAEVLEMLKDSSFSKEDAIEWLYAEAKGEAK